MRFLLLPILAALLLPAARASARALEDGPACASEGTTLAINRCMGGLLDGAEARQATYLQAAMERHADRPELARIIAESDARFAAYRETECGAVWEDWKDGTIRTAMALACAITLTERRTHDIWRNWLTYMDSTPPMLPEPEAAR